MINEFIMCSHLRHNTFIDNNYLISITDSRKTMCNNKLGKALHQVVERLLYQLLAFTVK
jgi:hypothetical protein